MEQNERKETRLATLKTTMIKQYMNKILYTTLSEFEPYQSLKFVDIRKNNISCIPKDLGILSELEVLNLSNNNLGASENWSWLEQTAIKNNLLILNLSKNSLTMFPMQIVKLNMLMILIISCNKLTYLPQSIKYLKKLIMLDVSVNELLYLPACIYKLPINYANISRNSFSNNQICYVTNLKMPSLVELSTKIVLNRRLEYDASVIPYTLIRYFDTAEYCVNCGDACFDRYIKEITNRIPYTVVATDVNTTTDTVQFECYYCSVNCSNHFRELINQISN